MIDNLDRKIVNHICKGVYSYNDLAKLCNVGRNTIYRRINKLEKMGIINSRIMAIPNFDRLDLSAIIVGINIDAQDTEKTIAFLKNYDKVKLLWTTFGTHDIVFTMVCDKSDVGKCVYELRSELAKLNIKPINFDSSGSISWEKIDLTPNL